jgi:hypothetical protein
VSIDIDAKDAEIVFSSERNNLVQYIATCDNCELIENEKTGKLFKPRCAFVKFKPYKGKKWQTLDFGEWAKQYGADFALVNLIKWRAGAGHKRSMYMGTPEKRDIWGPKKYIYSMDGDELPYSRKEVWHFLEDILGVWSALGRFKDKSEFVERVHSKIMQDDNELDNDQIRERFHQNSFEIDNLMLGDERINRKKVIEVISFDYGASKKTISEDWWGERKSSFSYSTKGNIFAALFIAAISFPFWGGLALASILAIFDEPLALFVLLPCTGGAWFLFLGGAVASQLLNRHLLVDFEADKVTLSEGLLGIKFYAHSKSVKLSKIKCVRAYEAGEGAPGADRVKLCMHENKGKKGDLNVTMIFAKGKFDPIELAERLGVDWKPRRAHTFHHRW